MKNTLSVFDLKQQKSIQNQTKKINQNKIPNQNFKFDFQIHSKLYLGTFRLRTLPRRESAIYMGTFVLRTLPCPRTFVRFAHERSFLSRTKV